MAYMQTIHTTSTPQFGSAIQNGAKAGTADRQPGLGILLPPYKIRIGKHFATCIQPRLLGDYAVDDFRAV
jgi:hypothetical protein